MPKTDTKKKLVLLDAHAILHRAYHALPDFMSSKGEATGGIYGLSAMLIKAIGDLKPDYLIACYDLPGPTFRHEAFDSYKAGRKAAESDLVSQIIRSRDVFKAFDIPIYDCPGFEADDMLGTIVEKVKKQKDISVVIASGDMDTLQLVEGKKIQVYTMKKGLSETVLYDEERVKERFGFGPELLPDYKGLNGDPSDNIPGVKGVGEKTATTLILNFGSIEDIYKKLKNDKAAFLAAGIKERIVNLLLENEEEALFSKELATIRRDAPINFGLPEKTWRESVELSKITALFNDLEFRTLGARAAQVLGMTAESIRPAVHEEVPKDSLLPVEENELKLAVWLLNSNITNPEQGDILRYARTNSFKEAQKKVLEQVRKEKLDFILEKIEKPLSPVLAKMEKNGVKIDLELLKKLSVDFHKKLKALEAEIWREAGEEFNIASPKQLGEILFVKMGLKAKNQKRTGTGALSTKESELSKLKDIHPIIPKILEHREFSKLLSTYIDNIPVLVAPDGRLHTHFVQTGTTTGRMASRDPNLQNIPNKSDLGREIRKVFIAEPGNKIVSFDYSQIELRIAAFLSGDKKLLEIFKKGEDVHTAVASEVFGVPKEQVTPEMRRRAKVINFGIIYGMGINALRANLGTDRGEAQIFYDSYFHNFSGLAEYLENVKAFAYKNGYTETLFGRKRYFEGLKSKLPYVRAGAERMAVNAPIQGTEADIIKLAMIQIDDYITQNKLDSGVKMLLQVHDELVFEISEPLIYSVAPKIKQLMEGVVDTKKTRGVICEAEGYAGNNWEDLEKI